MGGIIEYFGMILRYIFFLGKRDIKVLEKENGYSYMVGISAIIIIGFLLAYISSP